MKIEMRDTEHLWIIMGDQSTTNQAEVIICLDNQKNVRISDLRGNVVKVRLTPELRIQDILRNDIFLGSIVTRTK